MAPKLGRHRRRAEVLKASRLLTVCTSHVTVDDALCAVATITLANPNPERVRHRSAI